LIVAAPLLFWCISLFPAVLTPDSYAVLTLVQNNRLSDIHTLAYELTVKLLGFNGHAIYLVTITQSLISYYTLFVFTRLLGDRYLSRRQTLALTSILYATPFFGPIGMTLWKDSFHASLVSLALFKLFPLFFSGRGSLKSKLAWGSVLLLGLAFRHDAPFGLIIFGFTLFAISCMKKRGPTSTNIRHFSGFILLVSIISIFSSQLSSHLLKAEPTDSYMSSVSFLLDLEYVNSRYPAMLTPEAGSILDKISGGASLHGAAACDNPYNFWNSGLDVKQANIYAFEIPRLWLEATRGNARDSLLKARFCRAAPFLPSPLASAPKFGYWPTTGISPNSLGFENPPILFPAYTLAYMWVYIWSVNGNLLAWPGLHLTLIILSLALLRKRCSVLGRFKDFLGLFSLYLLSRSLILFLFAPSQEFRYMNSVYYLSLPVLSFLILQIVRFGKQDLHS
jgi:hypothetical protein